MRLRYRIPHAHLVVVILSITRPVARKKKIARMTLEDVRLRLLNLRADTEESDH